MRDFVFTSSSVLPGHPDKLCDRVSDAIVDAYLSHDADAHVMAECAIASDVMFLVCHGAPGIPVDHAALARDVVREVGYSAPELDPDRIAVMTNLATLDGQDAPMSGRDLMASNNATVFGYACDHTPDFMPAPIKLAHTLAQSIWNGGLLLGTDSLCPDGQVQVGMAFRDRRPVELTSITVLVDPRMASGLRNEDLNQRLLEAARKTGYVPIEQTPSISLNPPGASLLGGPARHPGLTGRKMAVDTYGDFSRQGSSALSGKDVTRIERIGAYAARYAAKNIVAAGLARECEVQLSYSVGVKEPVSVETDSFGTGELSDAEITAALKASFDFRPGAISEYFDLARLPARRDGTFYRRLTAFGQVGERDFAVPWEALDLSKALKAGR